MRGEVRLAIGFYAFTSFVMGAQFMFTALLDGVPMPPQTHGELVYEMPAELWAGYYMLWSLLIMVGMYFGKRKVALSGALIGMMLNVLFSMAADAAEFGYLLEKGSWAEATRLAGLFIWMLIAMEKEA